MIRKFKPGKVGVVGTMQLQHHCWKSQMWGVPGQIIWRVVVWVSERDIRLIVRIFDFKEYIFNFEDQSLKDFWFESYFKDIKDIKDIKDLL